MNATLVERVKVLAAQRRELAEQQATMKVRTEAFENETRELRVAINVQRDAVNASELMIRTLAIDAYRADETDTTPAPGIGIRVTKCYAVDPVAGLAWAKEKQMCLVPESLDVEAVKKVALATPLPFVTITREPSATITKDLDNALAADAALATEGVAS